ncbi:MAG: O-antigen/teichoic acid export membrane protein [Granulosicoccus sp.]|jgi:O-antigen/teichoic acid export membrane protein
MSKSSPSLSRQSIAVFIGQVSGFAINFLTPILLVRIISKTDYGVLQQFLLMGNTMLPILGLGLASSLYYFFPINQGEQRKSFVFNTYLKMAASGFIFVVGFYFLGKYILGGLGMETLGQAGNILSFYIMFLLSGTLIDFLFILEQKVQMTMGFNPIDKFFRLILLVGTALWHETVQACMWGLMIYAGLRFVFISYYVIKNYYNSANWKLVVPNMRTQLAYSLPFAAGIIFTTVSQRIDKLLVNRYITPEEFAIYSLAFFSIPLVDQAFASINNVVTPKIANLLKEGNKEDTLKLYRQVVGKTSSIAFPAIIYFTVMAPELLAFLFTEEYVSATPFYRIYLLLFILTMTSYGIVLRAAGKTKWIMLSNFIGMAITAGLGLVIIPKYALWGAIVTAICGSAVPILLQLHFERKVLKVPLSKHMPWGEILKGLLASLTCIIPVLLIRTLNLPPFISLAITATIFFPIIGLVEWKLGIFAFEKQLESLLRKYLPGRKT